MTPAPPLTTEALVPLENWLEWKACCALAACAERTRVHFHQFD